jgi:hypothetical protein
LASNVGLLGPRASFTLVPRRARIDRPRN